MFFVLLELLLAAVTIVAVVTQVILPLIKGTPFFPAFKSDSAIEAELAAARQKVRVAELENERDALLNKAENLRNSSKEDTNA
jgi:hypothetical protein